MNGEGRIPSRPKYRPYALAIVNGVVWYNESGMRPDTLVRFDPETKKFQSRPIPSGRVHAGIIRHMRPPREGNLLIDQSSTNCIILVPLDPPAAAHSDSYRSHWQKQQLLTAHRRGGWGHS